MNLRIAIALIVACLLVPASTSAQSVQLTPVSWSQGVVDLKIYRPSAEQMQILENISANTPDIIVRSLVIDSPTMTEGPGYQLRFKAVWHFLLTTTDQKNAQLWFQRPEFQDNLQSLTLAQTELSDAWFQSLTPLNKCESIELLTCDISDCDLTPLAEMKTLRIFKWFFASGTNAQVASLARSRTLEVLSVEGDAITDTCLTDVARMNKLKTFMYLRTSITPEGIKTFRAMRPDIKILGQ